MAYKTRVNPKTGNTEYKVRYYFLRDGKKRDSETSWFASLDLAEREAKRQKENKEKEDRHNITQRRDKKLITAYEDFCDYLEKEKNKEKSNTDVKEYNMAKAILNNHMPIEVQEAKLLDDYKNRIVPFCENKEIYSAFSFGLNKFCSAVFCEGMFKIGDLDKLYNKDT